MKRFLCILLTIAMLFMLCSCKVHFGGATIKVSGDTETTTSKKTTSNKGNKEESDISTDTESDAETPDDDTDDDDEPENTSEWNLDNTYYKLTTDKKITVGYIGGSVTVGTGSTGDCWRTQMNEWFKSKYGAEVTEINAAIGGSSSVWGAPRYESWILEKKPDLVFIEFSINDFYTAANTGRPTQEDSAVLLDYMIRKTQKELPNCDIVVLSVVDSSTIKAEIGNANAKGHSIASAYEGVTWIDLSDSLRRLVGDDLRAWNKYVTDSVHPNALGYKAYSDCIKQEFEGKFEESAERKPAGLKPHTVKNAAYKSYVPSNYTISYVKDMNYDKAKWELNDNLSGYKFGKSRICAKATGATLNFEFTGTTVSIFGEFAVDSKVEITLDGSKTLTVGGNKKAGEVLLWTDLENKKHTVTVKVNGAVKDDTTCQIACFATGA